MVTADEVTLLLYTQGDTPVAELVPGGEPPSGLVIEYPDGTHEEARLASSHFGYGIVT